jgi:hypothetical protein
MDCFFPGRVVVGPKLDSEGGALAELLSKEFGSDFEYEFGVGDILQHNDLSLGHLESKYKRSLPFVGRVPEGAEAEMAARILGFSQMPVGAATPDYLVRPAAPITIDASVLGQAIAKIRAKPRSPRCGRGCKVGIVDSRIDQSLVPNGNVRKQQYDALSPLSGAAAPADQLGHGSLVARIVSEIAPGAELISVRAFSQSGTISSVVAALYLAEAAGPCDILNLSLSVNCAPVPCAVCNTPALASINIGQLDYFFRTFMDSAPNALLVAAAGNNVQHLALPAAFDRVIAVGSFDYSTSSPISSYHQVPSTRFVLAPGGRGVSGAAFGQRAGFAKPTYLHGTSFATAFVSAFAAKVACARSVGCGTLLLSQVARTASASLHAAVLAEIDAQSNKSWVGFDSARHGLGAMYF